MFDSVFLFIILTTFFLVEDNIFLLNLIKFLIEISKISLMDFQKNVNLKSENFSYEFFDIVLNILVNIILNSPVGL